jgi:hypothetical protein
MNVMPPIGLLTAQSVRYPRLLQQTMDSIAGATLLLGRSLGLFGVAFPEVQGDFLLRPMAPRFRFFEPAFMVLLVERCTHSAQQFLGAIFRNLFHLLLLCRRFGPGM